MDATSSRENSNEGSSSSTNNNTNLQIRDPSRVKSIRILRYNEVEEENSNKFYFLRKNPLNGGYKFIALTLAFITLFAFSATLCMSLLTSSFTTDFNASRGKTSLFSSVEYGVFCLVSIAIPMIMDMMESRIFLILSYLCLCVGLFVPSYLDSFDAIIAVYAIFVGPAASALQFFGIAANSEYFDQLGFTGTAVGISLSAIGAGGIAFTYYIQYFLETADWRVTLRYCTLLVLLLGVLTVLAYCPRTYHRAQNDKMVLNLANESVTELGLSETSAKHAITHLIGIKPRFQLADFTMLLVPRFAIFTMATILATFMFYAPYVHLIPHALDKGLSGSDASFLLVIVGIANVVMRPLMGTIVDKLSARLVYFISVLMFTVCCIAWIFAESKVFFYVLSPFLGISIACYIVAVSMVPGELLPAHRIGAGVGFSLGLSFFAGACFAGPIMGEFRDIDGDYVNVLIMFAAFSALSTLLGAYLIFTPNHIPGVNTDAALEESNSNAAQIDAVEMGTRSATKALDAPVDPRSVDTTGHGSMYVTEAETKRIVKDFCQFYSPWYDRGCPNDAEIGMSNIEFCTNYWKSNKA